MTMLKASKHLESPMLCMIEKIDAKALGGVSHDRTALMFFFSSSEEKF